jgi:hypothetical protein
VLTDADLDRLAAAGPALRPDWDGADVRAHLAARHAHRQLVDVAVALAVVAVDPDTRTPQRLDTPGPWWGATRALAGWCGQPDPPAGPGRETARCALPGHEYEAAGHCRCCRSERIAGERPALRLVRCGT